MSAKPKVQKNKEYQFTNGLVVTLRRIKPFLLSRLMVDNTDKYPIPEVVRVFGTRRTERLVPDYDNEMYRELVEAQQGRDKADTLANICVFSVVESVPKKELDFYTQLAKSTQGENYDDNYIKSLWLFDQMEDEEELGSFQEAILGQDTVTAKGVAESEKKFP